MSVSIITEYTGPLRTISEVKQDEIKIKINEIDEINGENNNL